MSNNDQAIKIQSGVRGWMCRKDISLKNRCLEFRLKNILPVTKPPVYRKKSKSSLQSSSESQIILIQKHIRGFLQRKKFQTQIIEKMLKEQEDHYKSQIEKIENELRTQEENSKNTVSTTAKSKKSEKLYLELPLPMAEKRSPSKYRLRGKEKLFDYDYYILAAIEIQRVFRGFISRKRFGTFKVIRERIAMVQRVYRDWREKKDLRLENAAILMHKQTNIVSLSYSSYLELKSLILAEDKQGMYDKFVNHCEDRLESAGVNSKQGVDGYLEERVRQLEQEKFQQESAFQEIIQSTKNKYKSIIDEYLKGLKTLKFGMEVSQKSNYDQVSKLVKSLAEASKELESDSFCETSTFLPDMSFIEKSLNII